MEVAKPVWADCATDLKSNLGHVIRRQPRFFTKWIRLMRIMTDAPSPVEYTDPATPILSTTTKT